MQPDTRYARSGGVQVAYQVTGEGPVDLVMSPGTASHLDLDLEWPEKADFLKRRAGVHTGECELAAGDVSGIAVHTGARIAALASPNEVLVSGTVHDLVAGSGLRFEARGTHALKGVPGAWRIFSVRMAPDDPATTGSAAAPPAELEPAPTDEKPASR
jgi:class 3 adenylate cyclase